jgi:ABC-type antimicrobial peptide transport system permease subunit
LGLTLAIVGLSGLLAYSVAQRRGEIAIRMALGADAADVRRLVLQDAMWFVGIGVVLGLPLAWASTLRP